MGCICRVRKHVTTLGLQYLHIGSHVCPLCTLWLGFTVLLTPEKIYRQCLEKKHWQKTIILRYLVMIFMLQVFWPRCRLYCLTYRSPLEGALISASRFPLQSPPITITLTFGLGALQFRGEAQVDSCRSFLSSLDWTFVGRKWNFLRIECHGHRHTDHWTRSTRGVRRRNWWQYDWNMWHHKHLEWIWMETVKICCIMDI